MTRRLVCAGGECRRVGESSNGVVGGVAGRGRGGGRNVVVWRGGGCREMRCSFIVKEMW